MSTQTPIAPTAAPSVSKNGNLPTMRNSFGGQAEKSSLELRRKVGRPRRGKDVMTSAERVARHREKIRALKARIKEKYQRRKRQSRLQRALEKEAGRLGKVLTRLLRNRGGRSPKTWRPFEEARDFIRSLNISTWTEWYQFCASGSKPGDIPSSPHMVYKTEWRGARDWFSPSKKVKKVKKVKVPRYQTPRCPFKTRKDRKDVAYERNRGITVERYNQLIQEQNSRCALCRDLFADGIKRPVVDHDHTCKNHREYQSCIECIRGVLCTFCNTAILSFFERHPHITSPEIRRYLQNRPLSGEESETQQPVEPVFRLAA